MMPKLLVFSTSVLSFSNFILIVYYVNKIIIIITDIKARKTFLMKLEII